MKKAFSVALVALAFLGCGRSEKDIAESEAAEALRTAALTETMPVEGTGDETMVVIFDLNLLGSRRSVRATKDGDASFYNTTRGGVIHAGGREPVRQGALELVRESTKHRARMTPVTSFPLPESGNVRFYVRTPQQVSMAEAPFTEVTDEKHPLHPFFAAAMDLADALEKSK